MPLPKLVGMVKLVEMIATLDVISDIVHSAVKTNCQCFFFGNCAEKAVGLTFDVR